MKDIENELKEKYDEVEVPSYMFDTSRVFKRVEEEKKQRNKKIITVAASIIVILLAVIMVVIAIPKNDDKEEIQTTEIANDNSTYNIKGEIIINHESIEGKATHVENLLVVKDIKNMEYIIVDNVPYTKIKAYIYNVYVGNLNDEIEIYVPGGIFKAEDVKSITNIDIENDLKKYENEDYLKVMYYNEFIISMAEENKTYITTFYEEDGKYFVDMNRPYGFKEYDPETNIVKDDMGDVELDIDQYLDSIKVK